MKQLQSFGAGFWILVYLILCISILVVFIQLCSASESCRFASSLMLMSFFSEHVPFYVVAIFTLIQLFFAGTRVVLIMPLA